MSYLSVHDLSVVFRQFELRGISLTLERGQTLVLLGPSGSGKSVLLETIAGFHHPSSGRIELVGRDITRLPPEERGLGFMFQDYALFPHLTVEQNIAFGLRGGHRGKRRINEVLELLGARHLLERRPATLSGGEKQRVALARALATEPQLFLFDEPLSALDAMMRENLREELRLQLRSLGATSLYVTHDRLEALVLADVIAIIQHGTVRQAGPPGELFGHPADAWVAEFLGLQVLCPQRIEPSGPGRVRVRLGDGTLEAQVNGQAIPDTPRLAFRPEDVNLEWLDRRSSLVEKGVPAVVRAVVPLGPLFRVDLDIGAQFSALLPRRDFQRLELKAGGKVLARIEPDDLLLVPERRNPGNP